MLLAMEWSRHNGQRGLVASWPKFGAPCGLFLANLSVLAISSWSGDQFATWGWRVPFALSIILVGVGLWIRLDILETPVFHQLLDKKKIERTPVIEVIKKHPKLDFGRFRRREREHFPCAARYGTEFLDCLGLAGT